MFGRKKSREKTVPVSGADERRYRPMTATKTVDTVIGKNTELTGNIKSTGTVRVDGKFDGEIDTTSDVVIGEEGYIKGFVKANNLVVAGQLEGDTEVKSRLEIVPTGSLVGNAKTGVLVIEEGAVFKGQVEMAVKEGKGSIKQTITPTKGFNKETVVVNK
ncbi:MAG TPA: polymer-forming cytoskeletal protein [Firmicutes bacterium]|jgi:cytoskeletal protein CcmA (bactofilin family)|nr:polymer-forming cytoskeletal protein [Bacillota bacterium]